VIEFVRGYVDYVNPEYIVVENNEVGYLIYTPNPFVFHKSHQEKVTVYTYHYVREDTLALYGFKTREERALFVKLLNVSGIGPKGGLAILATGQPEQVVKAIENEDEKFLVKFPGVGKKTARQMILDLKGKVEDLLPEPVTGLFDEDGQQSGSKDSSFTTALEEALEALKVLGYAEREINKVVPKLKGEDMTTDQYIKKALQLLLK